MPISFKFENNNTKEAEQLSRVDELICEAFKEPVRETEYHPVFDVITDLGFGILRKSNKTVVTQADYEAFMAVNPQFKKPSLAEYLPIFKRFLYEDYTFHAWR